MNQNYDSIFLQTKQSRTDAKLLLHVCCAPCATYCLTQVLDSFDTTLYYANDNITDRYEWQKRLDEVRKLVDIVNAGKFEIVPKFPLKLIVREFDNARFFAAAHGLEQEKEGGARCTQCFRLRLTDAYNYATEHGFETFGTTLTVSPYKNSRLLNDIGTQLQTDKTLWLPSDFKKRNGYNESVRLSQKYGLYRQHYCGCEFSLQQTQNDLK
ncbi:MAG: epoxyqueuosine reductase QueH [Corallococcus sp.]|nr:epoxyqueuosine reductase QueH [Corallococcus sp.]MCM1359643.1 epoxyqueuosine reductase QueH [Corallococcus sp.]MCM1395235.1 epoxyqueuosine reductase QueH [Corallococcus sp.]